MSKYFYIAYGPELNQEFMCRLCPTAKYIGKSELNDYRLRFRGEFRKAQANAERVRGYKTPAIIWQITPLDESFLDTLHGYPFFSKKRYETVEVYGIRKRAMMYVMNHRSQLGHPNTEYYAQILDGYISAGFDLNLLQKAAAEVLDG